VNATKGKKLDVPTTNPVFDQKACEFHPHILAFPAGSTIDVTNSDGILHNIHTTSTVNPSTNQAQPKFKPKIQIKVEKAEWPIAVKCDVHGWMSGYWISADTPYFALTDANGNFKITDLPPGDYQVQLWQEKLGKKTMPASIKAKEETKVAWTMK
jgi:plastocyanin